MDFKHVKIEVFIPNTHLEPLREALNRGGAGIISNYDNCISITHVDGFWRPLEGADPYEGKVGEVCRGSELKVEVRCAVENIEKTIEEIVGIHPYEEPVINIIPLVNHLFIKE